MQGCSFYLQCSVNAVSSMMAGLTAFYLIDIAHTLKFQNDHVLHVNVVKVYAYMYILTSISKLHLPHVSAFFEIY